MSWFIVGLVGLGLLLVWLEPSIVSMCVAGCLGAMAVAYGILRVHETFRE